MGIDVTLGVIVFLAGLRGWLRGFMLQAIQIGALVGCVYLANPGRDLARPYVQPHFPTMSAEVLDRLLWWSSAVASYVVTSGIALSLVRAFKKRPYGGEPDTNRGNQGAGFLLGALKGAVIASFLAGALIDQAPTYLKMKSPSWFEDQFQTSRAMRWAEQYQPSQRIWNSPPVQMLVAHVRANGLMLEGEAADEETAPKRLPESASEAERPVQTASETPAPKTLRIPRPSPLDPDAPDFLDRLEREMRREGIVKSR